jgi:hypothetical protein
MKKERRCSPGGDLNGIEHFNSASYIYIELKNGLQAENYRKRKFRLQRWK